MALPASRPKLPVAVNKPTPYNFDLGLLLANDPNPVELDKSAIEDSLAATARDGAQALINQLLTACPLQSTSEGVLLTLPPPSTDLPREKPVPKAKEPTKWERFAAKRGIKPKTREQRKNLAFDEDSQEWRRKWGYKGMNKKGENDWLVEVDAEKELNRAEGTTIRGDKRRERKEKIKRNERKMRKNQRDAVGKR
ncbi:Regulator of ribosome biosynthesis [Colletotrichum orbiculare MAFF 240422]|uniref:Ribosome biogenesis regulatory protein n=1 Tax=Colletotrichum orbiculare (strain 104-T / ATCC 96160 / CBS 514.97 / LARS 414 / MAFF 240422) TaxID=1213857 RepID=N4W1S8_COLOR|nr:Regulator of ribosome biosynthesis [Colletotrichum orbiculare MAFF 240422]